MNFFIKKEAIMIKRCLVVFFMVVSFFIFGQSNPKYLFKIATEAPDGTSWAKAMREIAQEVKTRTNGEVDLIVYPGGVMGDQITVIKKIKIGQLNGATLSGLGLSYIYKDYAVFGFPLLYNSYDEFEYVVTELSSILNKEFEKRDFIILAWSNVGLIYLYSKNPVNSLEKLKKSKPLLIADDIFSQSLFDEIGVKPIPLQMSDVLTALQTGIIDTIFSTHYGVIAMQWVSKLKYVADFPITLMTGAIVVDSKLFYSMPINYRNELKSLFKKKFDELNQKVKKDDEAAIELLKKRGEIKILNVEESEKQKFIDVCTKMAYKMTEKEYSRELYNKVVETLKKIKKEK